MSTLKVSGIQDIHNVGTVQIPHHGSKHSYNDLINDKPGLISVISAGMKNSYRHPNGSVIKAILNNDGILNIVNETPGSACCYKVYKK